MPHRHLVAYGEAMGDIKLGYNTGYWSAGPSAGALEAVKEAERLGFNSVWTAEAYGSDALTPLAWWGAATETLQLGTAIMQMSARTPAATAMAAITMDHLSNGRFILGVGASGPQVVEGWYGQPYPKPLARTREYVEIVRSIVARDKPVEFHGEFYDMPFQGGAGLGKALKSTVHPLRTDIPIYLAAEGPKNVALSAEICDGWLPLFFSPKDDKFYRDCLQQGFDASGDPTKKDRFEVTATAMIIPGDDVEKCADLVRPFLALYAGGMGSPGWATATSPTRSKPSTWTARRPRRPRRSRWRWSKTSRSSGHPTRSATNSRSGARPASPSSWSAARQWRCRASPNSCWADHSSPGRPSAVAACSG
jgi:F420-dependent oxidoreductase-like protein